MRFETSKSVPPHLNRRLQLRMLGFVGLIGVIMFFMGTLQNKQKPKGKVTPLPGSPDAPWFQVEKNERPELKDGEFLSLPDGARPGNPNDPEQGWKEPPPLEPVAPADPAVDQEIAGLETRFDKGILHRVKDNTIGVRRDEAEAYYRLLYHARKVPTEQLERAGATDVQYINLMMQPERYRGEPVTIHGDLWRLYELEAGPNNLGLKILYEAWIFTADSDKNPYRVVFTSLPRELEPGVNLRKPVRVTGYFFKREGYASGGGVHVAPTLLAQRIIPFRPPGAPPSTDAIVPYMIGLISAVGLAFLVTLVSFAISDRRAARVALQRELNAPPPSFAGIDGGPMLTVQESLRLMEEQERQALASAPGADHRDVSASLHARDRVTTQTERPPAAAGATNDELAERRRTEARTVQAWTTQQHGSRNGVGHAPDSLARDRERREADRVLNNLTQPAESTNPPVVELGEADIVSVKVVSTGDIGSTTDGVSSADSESTPEAAVTRNGPSKLAAWENEIRQIATPSRTPDDRSTEDQRAAQAELDRDQAARAQELNDHLQHQRAELEQEQEIRAAREREQAEREQRESAQTVHRPDVARTPASPDRLTIDRADRADRNDGR